MFFAPGELFFRVAPSVCNEFVPHFFSCNFPLQEARRPAVLQTEAVKAFPGHPSCVVKRLCLLHDSPKPFVYPLGDSFFEGFSCAGYADEKNIVRRFGGVGWLWHRLAGGVYDFQCADEAAFVLRINILRAAGVALPQFFM